MCLTCPARPLQHACCCTTCVSLGLLSEAGVLVTYRPFRRHAGNGLGDGTACSEGVCWGVSYDHWNVCWQHCVLASIHQCYHLHDLGWHGVRVWEEGCVRRVCGCGRRDHVEVVCLRGWQSVVSAGADWSQMQVCHCVCVEACRPPLGTWTGASTLTLACGWTLGARREPAQDK